MPSLSVWANVLELERWRVAAASRGMHLNAWLRKAANQRTEFDFAAEQERLDRELMNAQAFPQREGIL